MRAKLVNQISFKDGSIWLKGQTVIIDINHDRPTMAQLENSEGTTKRVRSISLYKWFDEFIQVSMDDLEEAAMDGSCPTITGYSNVEPDGWDSEGMPSILLAAGVI